MTFSFPGIGSSHFNFTFLSAAEPLKKSSAHKPPPAKPPAPKPPSPFQTEYDGKVLKKISVHPTSAAKEKREDDAKTLKRGLNDAVRPAFDNMLKKYDKFSANVLFTIAYDNTGQVIQVTSEELTFKNNPSECDKIQFLVEASNLLRSQFRFKKIDDNGLGFFKVRFYMGVVSG